MYTLREWSVVFTHETEDVYKPPEAYSRSVAGKVYDNPKFQDGTEVVTSRIHKVQGRIVITRSGSVYELVGDPSNGYLEFLKDIGRPYDSDNPIQFIKRKNNHVRR